MPKKKKSPAKLKTFRVGFWYTEGGYINVEAKNEKEAEEIVEARLNDGGIDGMEDSKSYECTNRDWQTCDCIKS